MFTALLERSIPATLTILRKKMNMLAGVITPERFAAQDLTCFKGQCVRGAIRGPLTTAH